MAEAAVSLGFEKNENADTGLDLKDKIVKTHTEEIIIGLCAPIGTEIHFVAEEIGSIIKEKFNYDCKIIRLSDFIKEFKGIKLERYSSKFDFINALITGGNDLRNEKGNSVLAELAINEIAVERELRKKKNSSNSFESVRVCYIIDSIKNSEELELFRLIYTNLFYFMGVFSNIQIREKNLEKKGLKKDEIYKLIDRDSGEEIHFGQKVSNTFMQSDFFLRIDQSTSAKVSANIDRYLNLIFNSSVITPSNNETANSCFG